MNAFSILHRKATKTKKLAEIFGGAKKQKFKAYLKHCSDISHSSCFFLTKYLFLFLTFKSFFSQDCKFPEIRSLF